MLPPVLIEPLASHVQPPADPFCRLASQSRNTMISAYTCGFALVSGFSLLIQNSKFVS